MRKSSRASRHNPARYAGKGKRAHREAHTYEAVNMEEMKELADHKPGFIKAMWCGCQECEDQLKESVGVTSRCMPFAQETLSDKCVCCGKPATKMVYWGKHTKACLIIHSGQTSRKVGRISDGKQFRHVLALHPAERMWDET